MTLQINNSSCIASNENFKNIDDTNIFTLVILLPRPKFHSIYVDIFTVIFYTVVIMYHIGHFSPVFSTIILSGHVMSYYKVYLNFFI